MLLEGLGVVVDGRGVVEGRVLGRLVYEFEGRPVVFGRVDVLGRGLVEGRVDGRDW